MAFEVEVFRRRSLTLARISSLSGGLGLLLVVVFSVLSAYSEYERRLDAASAEAATESYFLADHAGRLFEVSEIGLTAATKLLGDEAWDEIAESHNLQLQLRGLADSLPYIEDIWFNDDAGLLRTTSFTFPTPFSDASDRDSFVAAKQPGDGLFIGNLIVGKVTKRPTFLISRRMEDQSHRFHGMASVTADIGYFTDYWQQVKLPDGARVTLLRADNFNVLAQYPTTDGKLLPIGTDLQHRIAEASRIGIASGSLTGERFGGFRQIGELPLFLSVDIARSTVVDGWRLWVWSRLPLAVLAALGFLALMLLALRQARIEALDKAEIERARAALSQTNAELRAEIANRESAEEQIRQMQKMEAVGQLTGGIAHDFNNMLSIIIGSLGVIQRRVAKGSSDIGRFIEAATEGAQRAATLTQRLLAFARRQPLAPTVIDVNRFVSDLSELLRRTLTEAVQVEIVLAGGLWKTCVDVNQLESAVLNLAVNARDAMAQGGKLTIETANASLDTEYAAKHPAIAAGQYVMIGVTDTGSGMSPDVIAKAFEPFFTTKPVGRGTGLGLSQVYGFVRQSGGHVKIYSEPEQGTTVKIYLPRYYGANGDAKEQTPAGNNLPIGSSSEIILIVEDEAAVRQLGAEALRELGYTVLQAEAASPALKILSDRPDIALLFTDVVMPEVNGRQLAEQARQLRPELRVLFTTGYTRNAVVHNGILDSGVRLLTKPYSIEQLARSIRDALDR